MKKLNFGCGEDIRRGYDNVDKDDFDFDEFPYPLEDNSYDYIYSRHVLEHLKYPQKVMDELLRIAKKGAIIRISVPHFNSDGAFSTLTHISYFSRYSFIEYVGLRKDKVEIIELIEEPSIFGMFIYPIWLRRKLSLILRGIFLKLKLRFRKK